MHYELFDLQIETHFNNMMFYYVILYSMQIQNINMLLDYWVAFHRKCQLNILYHDV